MDIPHLMNDQEPEATRSVKQHPPTQLRDSDLGFLLGVKPSLRVSALLLLIPSPLDGQELRRAGS